MSVLGLTWLLLCRFIEISDYEKAGSEAVSPLQSSCPTRSGIPRLPKFAILQDLKAPLSAAISSER